MQQLKGHPGRVTALAFAPDGRRLASCGTDASVRVWDLDAGAEVTRVQAARDLFAGYDAVAFAGGSRHVLARSKAHGLAAWDAADGRPVAQLIPGSDAVYDGGLAVAPRAGLVAANVWEPDTFTRLIHVWDTATWAPRELYRTTDSVNLAGLAFDPAGKRLAASVGVLDVATGERAVAAAFRGTKLRWSPDGRLMAWGGDHAEVAVADARTGRPVARLRLGRKHVQDFAFSADGRHLAVVSNEEVVRVWETATWSERPAFDWGIGKLKAVAFAPDGTLAACASVRGKLLVWDWDL